MNEIYKKSTSKVGVQTSEGHLEEGVRVRQEAIRHRPHTKVPRHLLLTNLAKHNTLLVRHLGENLAMTELMDENGGTNVQRNGGMKSNFDAVLRILVVVEMCHLGGRLGQRPSSERLGIRNSVSTDAVRHHSNTIGNSSVTSNGNVTGSAHELNEVIEGLLGHFKNWCAEWDSNPRPMP